MTTTTETIASLHNARDVLADAYAEGLEGSIPTSLSDLDTLTGGGLRAGQLTVIAGRPSHGASMLAHQIARNAANHGDGIPTCIAALESTATDIARRNLAATAKVQLLRVTSTRYGDDEHTRIRTALDKTNKRAAPLRIDDKIRTLGSIRTLIDSYPDGENGLWLLVVDGAHLLASEQDDHLERPAAIACGLKDLAVRHDIHVVATVPLDVRAPRPSLWHPQLADFGRRQAFAQTADIVILVHREDLYEHDTPRAGEIDLIVAKHRNSVPCTITAAFQGHYARIAEIDPAVAAKRTVATAELA